MSSRLTRAVVLASALAAAAPLGCDFNLSSLSKASLKYTDDARLAYGEAMTAFKNKSYEDARVLFQEVKRLFPYTRYARLAELRLADVDFEQAKYADAVTGYREYERAHKNDRDVEYARYRMAKALFLDIDGSFLLPPLEERDQATTLEAGKELVSFAKDFPQSRYITDVRYMREVVVGRIIRHELYVARYYLSRDGFEAAIARCDYALKNFKGSTLEAEAKVLKGEALLKWKKPGEARAVFEDVISAHGEPFATTARNFLAKIPSDAVAPKKPDPAKADPAKADPAKADPAKADPAKADPAKADPAKADPAKPEGKRPEPTEP
jgi:outer membrane protein assembly factor BamD